MCVLCNKASSLLITHVVFYWYSDFISHTHIKTQHTQGPVDWHTCMIIYLHNLLGAYSSYLYYIKWLNELFDWYQKIFKNYSLAKKSYSLFQKLFTCKTPYICWLDVIRCCKTRFFMWNTNYTDRNGVNKQITHTPHHTTPHTHTHIYTHKHTHIKNLEKDNTGTG